MEVLEMTVKITWHKPSENDLPLEHGSYYVVDNLGNHSIMTFIPDLGWGGMNWDSGVGSHGMKSNSEIQKWTHLLLT